MCEHPVKLADFCREVARMIADEEPVPVRDGRVLDAAGDVIVEIPDRLMLREAAARNHPEFDSRFPHRGYDRRAIETRGRLQNQRKAEPATDSVLALND